jgi:hypothetical protein
MLYISHFVFHTCTMHDLMVSLPLASHVDGLIRVGQKLYKKHGMHNNFECQTMVISSFQQHFEDLNLS